MLASTSVIPTPRTAPREGETGRTWTLSVIPHAIAHKQRSMLTRPVVDEVAWRVVDEEAGRRQ